MGKNLFDQSDLVSELIVRQSKERPRTARMDRWMQMYLLYDAWQDNKPLGQRRFVSNDSMTAVDTSHRVITRFPFRWQIAVDAFEETDDEEARLYGKMERSLDGFMADMDESQVDIGEMLPRKAWGYQGLLRGKVVTKVHLTKDTDRPSGIVNVNYDSRFTFETFNSMGLDSIICMTPVDGDELIHTYPNKVKSNVQPDGQYMKIEVWDTVKTGVCYTVGTKLSGIEGWLIDPVEHGFFDKNGAFDKNRVSRLPFVVVNVNGLAIKEKPVGAYTVRSNEAPSQFRAMVQQPNKEWRTTKRAIAERGRSLLCTIEDQVPQFNEAVASLWQHFSIDMMGVYFMNTRGGVVPDHVQAALGSGGMVGLEPGENVQRFAPTPVNQSGFAFMNILQEQQQKGTIAPVMQALGEFRSGFLQSRMEQVALNALEPFIEGQNQVGSRVGQLLIDQIVLSDMKDKVTLRVSTDEGASDRSFKRVEFDPAELRELGRIPVRAEIEPALPVDMMERGTLANLLVNNRRPLISRSTAQEKILRLPDSVRENDRIWEDMAQTEPIVINEEIAMALERAGKEDVAKLFRDRQAMQLVMEMAQRIVLQQQLQGSGIGSELMNGGLGSGLGRGNVNESGSGGGGVNPSTQPPEARGEGASQQVDTGEEPSP